MKNRKFLLILIISIFSVSLASAQEYVDDLYYKRQDKAEREAEVKRNTLKTKRPQEQREPKKYKDTQEEYPVDEEYYPGMFADIVNGNRANASSSGRNRDNNNESSDDSNIRVEIVAGWGPSWYGTSSWGGSYYSPWCNSYWRNPFDPFYSYGWGYNSCYSNWHGWGGSIWGGCDPFYGGYHNNWHSGWHNPHYSYYGGHNSYYSAPKYNRNNSTIGNGRRPGSTMIGSSSGRFTNSSSSRGGNFTLSNRLDRLGNNNRSTTRVNSNNGNDRFNNNRTNTDTKPSQYNRRDTYTPPPTTRQSGSFGTGTSTGSGSGTYQRGGNTGGNAGGGGTVVHSTRRR